jgi:2-dehydro-3-deoxygluconokinase
MGDIHPSGDLVTFGESMLRLSVAEGERIETATELDLRVAGAESNVAITASRLGAQAVWLSKLPNSPLARRIEHALRSHDVRPVVTRSDEGRVGTYYIEPGREPRGTNVVYDRADAAIQTAIPDALPLDRIQDADMFYTSGITPALSDTLVDTTEELLQTAREAGTRTVFDLNYRSKLWSPTAARETCTEILNLIDIFIVAERDAQTVLGYEEDAHECASAIADDYGIDTVVVTQGAEGAVAIHDGERFDQQAFSADTLDPIGTGDAFVGGFLARQLADDTVPEALAYGAAVAALKRTITGDIATITPKEVDSLLADEDQSIAR